MAVDALCWLKKMMNMCNSKHAYDICKKTLYVNTLGNVDSIKGTQMSQLQERQSLPR